MIKEMSDIDKAEDLALTAHLGQKRRSGDPYFIHPFRVYQRAKSLNLSKDIQIIALLHDIYEEAKNKDYIKKEIRRLFNDKVLYFILLLSHEKGVDYNRYILDIAHQSKIALTVKILDMLENLKDNPTNIQKEKYINAVKFLISNGIKIDSNLLNRINKF